MSKHSIALPSTTPSGRAVVRIGYHELAGIPSLFCLIEDLAGDNLDQQWNSIFVPGYLRVQCPDGFDGPLNQRGITLPPFIKQALREDIAKRQLKAEYVWQEDGVFEQVV